MIDTSQEKNQPQTLSTTTGARILVVEDEKIVAMDLQNMLRSMNYTLTPAAATGGEALQMVSIHRPDMVLMDIRLQGPIDGIAAAEQIWRQFGIPVIYVTAHSDEDTLRLAKGTEPYGFIIKPFEKDELRTAIEVGLYKHWMQKKLRESEQWLSGILNNTADAIVATDAKGAVVFINPAAEVLTRQKPADARGREWREILKIVDENDGGLPASVVRAFRESVVAELPPNAVLEVKGGTRVPILGSVAPIRDEKGTLNGFVFAFRDVSHRRRLEEELRQSNAILEKRVRERTEALSQTNRELAKEVIERKAAETRTRESETKFRSMAEAAGDAIFLFDKAGNILYSNHGAKKMFAYQDYEMSGKDIRALLAEADRAKLADLLHRFSEAVEVKATERTLELTARDKLHREFPIELSLASWTAGSDRFYVGILREITERRRAEAHLRFQANILSSVSDAIIVTNNDQQIIYWNAAAEQLYGVKMIEAIGKKHDEIVQDFFGNPPQRQKLGQALADTGYWEGELAHKNRKGDLVEVEASVGNLKSEKGDVIGQLILLRDVSERKRLQNMVVHSEKLAAMGQMAAAVAHELKTPMAVIFGFADVIRNQLKDNVTSKEHLETIKHQVMRCSDLVTNLLNFSRKQISKETHTFNVDEVVRQALTLVEPYARSHGVRVETQLASAPVRGTKDMLEQVVINLSTNAIDAMPKGGTLTIKTEVRGDGDARTTWLRVSDTGTGIPDNMRAKIYEPFFSTKSDGSGGTGLGLWLVKQIVNEVGGSIDCTSEVGKGTVFALSFPPVDSTEKKEVTHERRETRPDRAR